MGGINIDNIDNNTTQNKDIENNLNNKEIPDTAEGIEVQKQKKEVATKIKQKSIEKRIPLKAEYSKKYLESSNLDFKESVQITADILGVSPKYDKTFINKLKSKQIELGLKPDSILGDKTLGMLLSINTEKINIKLTNNTQLINFDKAIKEGNVTKEMLEVIKTKMSHLLADKPVKSKDKKYYSDSFFGKNMTNNLIARKLFNDFKKTEQGKNKEFDSIYEEVEKEELKQTTKLVENTISIMKDLDPKVQEAIQKATGKNISNNISTTTTGTASFEGKIGAAVNEIKKNPILMAGALVGFIMFLFGSRNGFAKTGFFGLIAVVGGPSIFNTMKNIGNIFGINMDSLTPNPEKVAAAKQATANAVESVKNGAKAIAEKTGQAYDKVEKALTSKNSSIENSILAKYPNLDKTKIKILTNELSVDPEFKNIKVEDITKTKFNNLSKETQDKFNKAGIKENSDEFKTYLEILKEKINDAKESGKSINTVGDYFDNIEITADTGAIAAGTATVIWGIATKSPLKIIAGGAAIYAGLKEKVSKFLESDTYKEGENTLKKYGNKMKSQVEQTINKLVKDEKLKSQIIELIDNQKFNEIKTLPTTNINQKELNIISNLAQKNAFEVEVEGYKETYIGNFVDTVLAETGIDTYKNLEKGEKEILSKISETEEKINLSDLPKADIDKLLKKLNISKISISRKINKLKLQDIKEKNQKITELKKEILEKKASIEKKTIKLKKLGDSTDEQLKKIDLEGEIEELKIEKEELEKELKERSDNLINTKKENFDDAIEKNGEILGDAITELTKFNKDFDINNIDLKVIFSTTGILSNKEIEKYKNIFNEVEKIEKEAIEVNSDNHNFEPYKKLKETFEKNINSIFTKILGKITTNLSEYPKEEIKNYKKLINTLNTPNIIDNTNFDNLIKDKKDTIFNEKITTANIEEIQILRENFLDVKDADKKIKERVKYLARNTKIENDKDIKEIIDGLKTNDIITKDIIKKIKEQKNIFELYKFIYTNDLGTGIKNIIEKKYGKLKIKAQIKQKKIITIKGQDNNTKTKQTNIINPNDLFKD